MQQGQPSDSKARGPADLDRPLLTVVVPLFNEQEVLAQFQERLVAVLEQMDLDWEIVYVNDGSTDGSLEVVRKLRGRSQRIAVLDLSRNFGKEIAMAAGLDVASGDAVVIIDADLQDPPELIPELVRRWQVDGYDNVFAKRTVRLGETWLKKATAYLFYRLMTFFGETDLPPDAGDFRLLSRRAVDALNSVHERHRFMKGLYAWIGFPSIAVPYERDRRHAGVTKWNYWKLCKLAVEGFTSYSTMPLRVAGLLGFLLAMTALCYGFFIIAKTLTVGDPVAGYPSLIVVISFLGGVQLLSLGVIGEYLARIFTETKDRPLYFAKEYHPSSFGILMESASPELAPLMPGAVERSFRLPSKNRRTRR